MRLVCPNCGAQYEVADDVIPTEGRDVQCSNCGHTWFEHPGASSIEDAFADIQQPAHEDATQFPVDDRAEETKETSPPQAEELETPRPNTPERQELDPAIADILREEAAREAEARNREARNREAQATLESQPDLGLSHDPEPAVPARQAEADRRMAALKGEESAATVAAAAATRRELLPDIEEINSSLRPDQDTTTADTQTTDAEKPRNSTGFRRGFFGMLLILIAALLVYMFADQIIELVPQLTDVLTSYVTWVDGVRLWLDDQLQAILTSISPSSDTPQN